MRTLREVPLSDPFEDEVEQEELYETESDAPYDAGDRAAVKEAEKAFARLESSKRVVIRQIMGTSEGRAWMNGILVLCNVFQTSFSQSALTMAYLEGKREIGLRLIADVVNACPNRYTEMRKERTMSDSRQDAAPAPTTPADVAPVTAPTAPPVPEPTGPGTAVAAQEQLRATEKPPGTILTGEAPAEVEKPAAEPVAAFDPEKITFPEGFTRNDELFGQFSEIAKTEGLSLPAAQKLANLYATAAKAAADSSRVAWNTTLSGWETEVKADQELARATLRTSEGVLQGLDAVKATVARVIDNPALTHPRFREALEVTGLGSHPAAVSTIFKWARMLSEGGMVSGNGPAPGVGGTGNRPDAAAALYPNNPRGGTA